jgi:predicted glycosyltransferase
MSEMQRYKQEHIEVLEQTKYLHDTSQNTNQMAADVVDETEDLWEAQEVKNLYQEYYDVINQEINLTGEV